MGLACQKFACSVWTSWSLWTWEPHVENVTAVQEIIGYCYQGILAQGLLQVCWTALTCSTLEHLTFGGDLEATAGTK